MVGASCRDIRGNWLMTHQSAFASLGLIDGGSGSLRTDKIIRGGDEENGEHWGKITLLFCRKGLKEQSGGPGLWWH